LSFAEASVPSKFRLNPFCLPSDTGCRFALLIVTVFGSGLFVYNALALHKLSVQAYQRCLAFEPSAAELSGSAGRPLELKDPSVLVAKSQAFAACIRGVERSSAIWMLGGIAVLFLATLFIVWFIPAVKTRRSRLVPFSPEDAPDVVASLESMSREAGLTPPPRFLWNPLNTASTGLAFGRPGDPCVALTGGLVTQFYTDQAAFRAVMLHELAHIRNGDVNKTYFAVATWYAFLAVALGPFLVAMSWDFLSGQLWRVLVLAILVYLSRTAVLRIRETYADVRASVWDTPGGALRRVIAALLPPKENLWQKWLRVHPTSAERSSALDNTENLFKIRHISFAGLRGTAFGHRGHADLARMPRRACGDNAPTPRDAARIRAGIRTAPRFEVFSVFGFLSRACQRRKEPNDSLGFPARDRPPHGVRAVCSLGDSQRFRMAHR
jgi:Zn-dependent protease with chaperone function